MENQFVSNILNKVTELPVAVHATLAAISVLWFQWAKGMLDASYAASLHPVDFATGQTSFSGETIKSYYAVMTDAGTLDIYVRTQIIDFGFILGFLGIGLFVCTLIGRLSRDGGFGRRMGRLAGLVFVAGGICDMIENGWSFVMLANPITFADWLAIPYSTFAALKFGLITLGIALAIVSLLSAVVGRGLDKPNIG
ncbi:hypothetical protein EU803_15405 [Loktanella sp. IMCC34160]|uniref:hypothetical protein n=1 Tax=Loktanella sp. IMCC34160 TaxID=2510646 RepID=UPI00101C8A32|nr:hypothetical protein [Loktanella sp. IMCC34160]RYG90002.1 hypothetical protein EU803_15405 [Loktanella sp. IMCC34160]